MSAQASKAAIIEKLYQQYVDDEIGTEQEMAEAAYEAGRSSGLETEILQFLDDYVATWQHAHAKGDCARPTICLVCRARKIAAAIRALKP